MLKLPRYDINTVPYWYQVRMGWTYSVDLSGAIQRMGEAMQRMVSALSGAILAFTVTSTAASQSPAPDPVIASVIDTVKAEEGFRSRPYTDTRGVITIGYGTNLAEGITEIEGEYLLWERLSTTQAALLKALPWLRSHPIATQGSILEMGYQLGVAGLLGFHTTLSRLEAGDCAGAQASARGSAWARETPARAKRVIGRLC